MKARLKEKHEVAKGTLMVTFALTDAEVDFRPGQYFYVTLPDVGLQDDKGLRRHISVVTSPNETDVLGLATRLRDSAFKRTLADLPVGAEVEVEEPEGDFVLPDETSGPLVFVAGGIGITVFRSMLLYIKEERLSHRIVLVYSNRDRESTAFLEELQELEQQIPGLRLLLTMTDDPGWDGESRRIDAEFIKDQFGDDLEQYTFLVAGPPGMAEGVQHELEEAGVNEANVVVESYNGY